MMLLLAEVLKFHSGYLWLVFTAKHCGFTTEWTLSDSHSTLTIRLLMSYKYCLTTLATSLGTKPAKME